MAKGKKTGGRTLGTPNKQDPERERSRRAVGSLSADYYDKPLGVERTLLLLGDLADTMHIPEEGLTRCEIDLELMTPAERAAVEAKLLNKTVADLKSVDASISTHSVHLTIEDRLRELCEEDDDE